MDITEKERILNTIKEVYKNENLVFRDTDKLIHVIRLKNQYPENVLIDLIKYGNVRLTHILWSQKNLSFDFCIDYITNDDYAMDVEDTYNDWYDCLKAQPHLKNEKYTIIHNDDDK